MLTIIKSLFNKRVRTIRKLDKLMYEMASIEDYHEYVDIRVRSM